MGELEIEGMVGEGRAKWYGMVGDGVGYARRGLEVEGVVGEGKIMRFR